MSESEDNDLHEDDEVDEVVDVDEHGKTNEENSKKNALLLYHI